MKKICLITTIVIFLLIYLEGIKAQTVTDIDGNVYNTVTIGTQTWMKENLKTTRFNDGTAIPLVSMDSLLDPSCPPPGQRCCCTPAWYTLSSPRYCWYDDNETNKEIYGALYNYYSIDTGNLCPTGWHVPTDAEWWRLIKYLDPFAIYDSAQATQTSIVAGGKLKAIGTIEGGDGLWYSPNAGATNESGFTALPGGFRCGSDIGTWDNGVGILGTWWSVTKGNGEFYYIKALVLYSDGSGAAIDPYFGVRYYGNSVRCLKDNSTSIIHSIYSERITLYPNPSTEKVYIKNGIYANAKIIIFDLQGNQVLSKQNDSNPIDISNLAEGIYIMKFLCSEKAIITKFIKE